VILLNTYSFIYEDIIKEYDKLGNDQDGYMKVVNFFFPQCEPGELGTGDY